MSAKCEACPQACRESCEKMHLPRFIKEGWDPAIWCQASPHEWKWSDKDALAMARGMYALAECYGRQLAAAKARIEELERAPNWTMVGQFVLDDMTSAAPFHAESANLVVWDGNAAEQLGEIVRRAAEKARKE